MEVSNDVLFIQEEFNDKLEVMHNILYDESASNKSKMDEIRKALDSVKDDMHGKLGRYYQPGRLSSRVSGQFTIRYIPIYYKHPISGKINSRISGQFTIRYFLRYYQSQIGDMLRCFGP